MLKYLPQTLDFHSCRQLHDIFSLWKTLETFCQALCPLSTMFSVYVNLLFHSSLFMSLTVDIDWHYNQFVPPQTFKCLRGDLYLSVIHHWNRQLKPNSFPLRKNRVKWGHYWPLSVLGLILRSEGTNSVLWYITWIVCSSPTHFCTSHIGLIGVNIYLICQLVKG